MKQRDRWASIILATVMIGGGWSLAKAPVETAAPAAPKWSQSADNQITLTDKTPGAVILYTLDGSDPTARSGQYLAPVDLSHGGTIRARAFTADRKQKSSSVQLEVDPLTGLKPIPSTLVDVTQDRSWPHYDWARRHRAECELIRQGKAQLVFIGDSIIHFWGGPPLGPERRTGQKVWDANYSKYHAIDMGFGWDRTENVLWRLDHGELDGPAPKLAVIMIGTNNVSIHNSPEDIAAGVKAVCGRVHSRWPSTKILLLAIFPRGHKPNPYRAEVKQINKILATFDGQDGITYLNIDKNFVEPDGTISKTTLSDYVHPTVKGYKIWVRAMAPTLNKLLAE